MTKGTIRLGVFTVSMPEYEPMAALKKLKQLGYDGVEWRVAQDSGDRSKPSFWSGNRTSMPADELIARAKELKRAARGIGIQMPSLGSYIDCFDLGVVERHMEAAVAIGARSLRIGPGGYPAKDGTPYWTLVDRARRQYAKVAALAKKHGVRAVIETHPGLITPSVCKAMWVLKDLDPRQVGIMWDPGNQVCEGSETYRMAIDMAGEYLAEVHVKNIGWERGDSVDGRQGWKTFTSPVHLGIVDWPMVIAELKRVGYTGWLMFEDFSTVEPLDRRLARNVKWFRKLLA